MFTVGQYHTFPYKWPGLRSSAILLGSTFPPQCHTTLVCRYICSMCNCQCWLFIYTMVSCWGRGSPKPFCPCLPLLWLYNCQGRHTWVSGIFHHFWFVIGTYSHFSRWTQGSCPSGTLSQGGPWKVFKPIWVVSTFTKPKHTSCWHSPIMEKSHFSIANFNSQMMQSLTAQKNLVDSKLYIALHCPP